MIRELRHDHVRTRKTLIDELLDSRTEQVECVLRTAVGCVVTKDEHELLTAFDGEAEGWERYKLAKIRIYDQVDGRYLSFKALLT